MNDIIRVPKKQHTVSKIVLKQFARRQLLTVYDRERGMVRDIGPNGAFRSNFDQHDPLGSEERWGLIEKQLPSLYQAIHRRDALGSSEFEGLIRDVLAMHWARSPAMKATQAALTEKVRDDSVAAMSEWSELLARAAKQRTGLSLGPDGLEWFNRRLHDELVATNREMWWSERNKIHFEFARERFEKFSIQVGYAAPGCDLLIGDAPVITRKDNSEGVGPHQGVAVGEATLVAMPFAPNVLVGLGPEPAVIDLPLHVVQRYNSWQIQGFSRWLACRPGGPSVANIRAQLPPQPRT